MFFVTLMQVGFNFILLQLIFLIIIIVKDIMKLKSFYFLHVSFDSVC